MKRKIIAMVMLVSIFSAGTLFGGRVNAMEASDSAILRARNTNLVTPGTQWGLALFTFDNYTLWKVQCYTNGQFRGVVLPMHSLSVWSNSGYTVLSARADFIDATPAIWSSGPLFLYPGDSYSWRLIP